jgi:tetratricopeptide (TPR) repeat protein
VADRFRFNQMLETLLAFSLVKRFAEDRQLGIHRLVQAVQMDRLSAEERRQWAERIVLAVNALYPRGEEIASWPQCQRYLEQAQACDELIQQHQLLLPEVVDLLDRVGSYLRERALYALAEPLFQRAHHILEQQEDPDPLQMATLLSNRALLYKDQGRYLETEVLHQRALRIREQHAGPEHLLVATSLYHLADLYSEQSKDAQADALFQQALRIREQQEGLDSLLVAATLRGLATVRSNQGKYAEAEQFYLGALHIISRQPLRSTIWLSSPPIRGSMHRLKSSFSGRCVSASCSMGRTIPG